MQDEYKTTAALYDPLLSKSLRFIRTNISTYIKHSKSDKIIDLCCGTGEQLRMLSKDNLHLTGVDLSNAMLDIARKKSNNSIYYLEADAALTPLSDSSFDIAILSFALHEKTAPQRNAIFKEACRLLHDNGSIIIADYTTPPATFPAQLLGKAAIPLIERLAGSTHYTNYKDWMKAGALAGFLQKKTPHKTMSIAPHLKGCVEICSVTDIKNTPLQAAFNEIKNERQLERKGDADET